MKKNIISPIMGIRHFGSCTQLCNPVSWLGGKEKSVECFDTLPSKREVYEITTVDVKPDCWKKYIDHKGEDIKLLREEGGRRQHVMSWKYFSGDITSRVLHLYKYSDGWEGIDSTRTLKRSNDKLVDARQYGKTLINQKQSELLKSFIFWPTPDKRCGESVYEISSYELIPGCMQEWGNHWKKGVECRQNVREDIPYAGFFTQLGQLHKVYHIWCFKSFKDRNDSRKLTWNQPDWKHVFSESGAFIKSTKTGILESVQLAGDDDPGIENDAWLQRTTRPYGGKGYAVNNKKGKLIDLL